MILILLAGLAFLFPLATYCLFLALLNSRENPTLVSGPWDFAGALFGTSGFLLVGGPAILSMIQSRWEMSSAHGVGWAIWVVVWLIYFGVLIGGVLFVFRRRGDYSVVYNVEPADLDGALQVAFAQLRLEPARIGNRIYLMADSFAPALISEEGETAFQEAKPDWSMPSESELQMKAKAAVEVDPFPSLLNVSIRWKQTDALIRNDVEAELAKLLPSITTADNPSAGWFLTVSGCLYAAILLGLLAFIILQSQM